MPQSNEQNPDYVLIPVPEDLKRPLINAIKAQISGCSSLSISKIWSSINDFSINSTHYRFHFLRDNIYYLGLDRNGELIITETLNALQEAITRVYEQTSSDNTEEI